MMKYEAIGIIETQYFAVAMEMLDQVSKATAVEFLSSQNYLGGKLVSVIVGGSISNVTIAIETAKLVNERKTNSPLKNAVVITNPHPEILKYVVPKKVKRTKRRNVTKKKTTTAPEKQARMNKEEKNDE